MRGAVKAAAAYPHIYIFMYIYMYEYTAKHFRFHRVPRVKADDLVTHIINYSRVC